MNRLTRYYLPVLLLTTSIKAGGINDLSIEDHRMPRVSGRIVKVYSGNRPEPYHCDSEGYKTDPNSCASFYRCVKERNGKFNVYRYQCAPGTVYDPDLETCNHPRSTRRTECGGMMKPTEIIDSLFVNEIDPQKELPRPFTSNVLAFTKEMSDKGIVTHTEARVTSQSVSSKSPLTTTLFQSPNTLDTTKYTSGYDYAASTNMPWASKTTTQPKATSNTKNTEICSDDGFTGDTDNCRMFYRCVGNQRGGFLKYEFFCSESTVWDEEIQSCNHPWAVKRSKCGRSISIIDKSVTTDLTTTVEKTAQEPTHNTAEYGHKTKKTIQQQLQISHGPKVSQTQTQISNSNQVIQNQTQLHYGDRIIQNKDFETKQNQTQIAYGFAVSQTQTQIDYGNKGMQSQLQIDHSNDSSQSQTQIHESTTSQTTTFKQDFNNNQCSESGFMGDSNDCKKFYRCVDSGRGTFTKYEYTCGDGTVWDQSIEACNHAWAVKECGGHSHSGIHSPTEKSTTNFADTTTSSHSATHSNPEAIEPDIDDIDVGYGNQGQSESSTLSPSTSTKTSTHKEPQYETTKKPEYEPINSIECKSSGFIGDVHNCKRFYRCVDNGMGGYTRHEFTCGEGTVWDSSIEACNHAWAVEKCGGSSEISQTSEQPTTATNGETTSTTAMPVDQNTEEPIHITPISSPSSTENAEVNKNNVCRQSGFMGDNKDCKKFYRCVDNGDGTYTRYDFTCGEGTVWDSKIEACNHEWAVEKCDSSSESTTSSYITTLQHSTLHDEDKENEQTTQNHEGGSTTKSSTTTVKNEVSTSNQDCTGSGFVGDKNDCKKFYRCVDNGNGGYDRYQFSCGEGTVWDNSISACNHAWAVKECGGNGSGTSEINHENTSSGTVSTTEAEHQETTQQHTTEKSTTASGNPSENEVTDGKCEREGFFGSLVDCKKFIRCVNDGKGGFTKYEFTCSEGTTWNQEIEACDHPSPDQPCGQDYQSTTKESHINDEMATETTTKMTSTTTLPSSTASSQETQKPPSASDTCESEGFYGDHSDCKKFYRCVDNGKGGYTKYEFSCGDGTVWNQEILACDHESDDKSCLSSGGQATEASGPQSESTNTGSQSESTTMSSSTTVINQGTDRTDSPASSTSDDKCTSEGFFPHPNDCKKFVRCVSNGDGYTRYEFSCGEGTIWVQEIQACDHDNGNKNCDKQSEPTTKPENHDHGSTSTTESGSSTNAESQTQHKEDDEYSTTKPSVDTGSDQCTSEGYFANKNNCKKFYRCVDNGNGGFTKYDFVCGEGTAWDSKLENCNHIYEVESCSENNKEESHTQQTMKEEDTSQAAEGTSSTTMGTTSSSGTTEQSENGSHTGNSDKCETEGYYGDSKDCKKFYRCVDDGKGGFTKHDFTCGEGTIWDQDITNCNHPQDVSNPSCKESGGEGGAEGDSEISSTSSTSSSSTTSSPEYTSSSSTSENNNQSSSNCSQEDSSKKPASSKDISCEKAGYYSNPNDCKKFYRCVDWDGDGKRFSVYHFECGEGTIWDPALDTCNHEESVYPPRDCSQTQAQTESSSEGTTTKKQEETTTQESTTTEKTTTQESTTSKQTTTEQSSTTEQSTTQQSITSEQTTQQSTTSEQTTTQQSTTSEQTTTQQSTTSEQTTTQQSTTSEQTTTQETTTSEQTTTQQSTTSEQTTEQTTTTQESTTSEQTTTQESTTSEQTTQGSTTSEQTTQESTTSEQTTEQTTTQESTTSEQSTTEQTTEETTEQTESSTTEGTTESSTEAIESSTTEQSSTTEAEQESTTEASSSDKECPETDDNQYLFVCPTSFKRHPKYCNMFYQCTEDDDTHEVKIATFKCPNDTIYDETQTQCVEEEKADRKCNGEIARRHRFKRLHKDSKEPITVDRESKSCPSVGYYSFEKNIECSQGFLKCDKTKAGIMRGYVHQCPDGYLFWSVSKRCEVAIKIRDCKRSSNDWQGRWNIPIDRKNVAF